MLLNSCTTLVYSGGLYSGGLYSGGLKVQRFL